MRTAKRFLTLLGKEKKLPVEKSGRVGNLLKTRSIEGHGGRPNQVAELRNGKVLRADI